MVPPNNNVSIGYSLEKNYPNPFNPSTTIQYCLGKDEFVKLNVYDLSGKLVKKLVNAHRAVGIYKVEFNAGSSASGTYFYRLEAGDYKNTKKMMLLK